MTYITMFPIDGIQTETIPYFISCLCAALLLCFIAYGYYRFVIKNDHLTRKERKIIEHSNAKVIEIHKYIPKPGKEVRVYRNS